MVSVLVQDPGTGRTDHAMLFIQYLQNNGEQVVLEAIDKPQIDLTSAKAVLAEGLKHEQYVTGLIHNIYDAAYSVKDFRTMQFWTGL